MKARALVVLLVLGLALAAAPAASGAPRWVSADSSKGYGACPENTPCTLEWAIEAANEGDEVIVKPGTYNVTEVLAAQTHLTIRGVEGQPRPRLLGTPSAQNFTLIAGYSTGSTTIRHLNIEASRDGFAALYTYGNVEISDVVAVGRGSGGTGIALAGYGDTLIRDSVVRSTKGGTALTARGDVYLRNVTAIGQGAGSAGLHAFGECQPNSLCDIKNPADVSVVNTILRGIEHDAYAWTNSTKAPARVDLSYSNWRTDKVATSGDGASIGDLGNNQTDPPAFRLAVWGDYHQASTSPTIDKGTTTPLNGPTDFDGQPRLGGAAVDIGADEFHAQSSGDGGAGGETPSGDDPAGGEPPASDPTIADPGPTAQPDTNAPALGALRAKPKRFRATKNGVSVAAKGGAKVTYTLDEPATLTFYVQRASAGRQAGAKCAKQSRSNAKAKRCTRWRTLPGTFAHAGSAGANAFRFTGRLNGKALSPARYRLIATPTDGAGNVGGPATAGFEIAR